MKRYNVKWYAPAFVVVCFVMALFPWSQSRAATLDKDKERKIYKLLPGHDRDSRFEASGVVVSGGFYYVIFDNLEAVGQLHEDLLVNHDDNRLIGDPGEGAGFEGITYDDQTNQFFVVVEIVDKAGGFASELMIYDKDVTRIGQQPIEYPFDSDNKGFEGIAHIRQDGEFYLLFLCEGNNCKGGKKGKKPGDGRIQVYREKSGNWVRVDQIKLPKSVDFKDYSGLDIMGTKIAVTSQEESRLWVGKWTSEGSSAGNIDFKIKGEGKIYRFPKKNGKKVYCNIEGVSFLTKKTLVLVSDKKKSDQESECADGDQSIHIFSLRTGCGF